jgi:glycosyl transferase family 25
LKSLFFSYDVKISGAYIIKIKGHKISESLAKRCADSCDKVGMKYQYWDAFDGTKDGIHPPENLNPFMKMVKIADHFLTRSEVACALSHISLWAKCVEDDVPLVVLEHDAIMVAPYPEHTMYNSISYLGCIEQAKENWRVVPTPPHGSMGKNYHFMCRAHSYSIDPAVAKNMLAHVLKYGINSSLDCMLRADIFPMHQMGVYAYDDSDLANTTILNRAETDRSTIKNDNLEI